jgi:hypothetical protein
MERDRARFDKSETERGERLESDAVLVEAGCKSDGVRKRDPEPIDSGLIFKTSNDFGYD